MTKVSTKDLWIGIDVGTQSVKVVIVGSDGAVFGHGSSPLASHRDNVIHEQNPEHWVAATRNALIAALSVLRDSHRARLGGISICATSGTLTTVDGNGAPVSTGIMYDDSRAVAVTPRVQAADPERWKRLGYRIQPSWALPKILWLAEHNGLSADRRIAQQADVVAGAIVGRVVASDWSHSLKSGFDLLELEWPTTALDSLGIDPAALPPVVAPGTPLGLSGASWNQSTGLPEGIPVFAGMTDGCAAQIGAATLSLGDWHSVIGTTLVVKSVSDHIVVDDAGALYSHRSPVEGRWYPGGASSVGAGAITLALEGHDLAALGEEVAARFDASPGTIPVAYPLASRGERFPIVNPEARGFLEREETDLRLDSDEARSDPSTLFAAIMLGVACVERLAVETMESAGVRVDGTFSSSGGGTANAWWTKIRATLLDRPIHVRAAEGSLGMAILAASSGGGTASLAESAERMSPASTIIEPDAHSVDALGERYSTFRETLDRRGWLSS